MTSDDARDSAASLGSLRMSGATSWVSPSLLALFLLFGRPDHGFCLCGP
jgi:hypothetical protein